MIRHWKEQVKKLKRETYALYYACQDSRIPWYARLLAGCVIAYVLSPIDLIPDFIPVLGQLDDLLLVPLGIFLLIKLIPKDVMDESRQKAESAIAEGKYELTNRTAAVIIICIWLLIFSLAAFWLWHFIIHYHSSKNKSLKVEA